MPNNPNDQTALELVTDSYRALRVLAEDELSLDQLKADLGFKELCGMLDQWRLDGWLVDNSNGVASFQLVAGQKDYTVGYQEDIDLAFPPAWITQVFLTDSPNGRTYPVQLCSNEEFYRAGRATNVTTAYSFYCTYKTEYPVATLEFYPIPGVPVVGSIVYPEHIQIPATINDSLTLSPGMRNAIVYSLANVLTMYYPTDASGVVAQAAQKYVDRIKDARRVPIPSALLDPSVSQMGTGGRMKSSRSGLYDIKSNSFAGRV